jgi:hypothetical protein
MADRLVFYYEQYQPNLFSRKRTGFKICDRKYLILLQSQIRKTNYIASKAVIPAHWLESWGDITGNWSLFINAAYYPENLQIKTRLKNLYWFG